MHLLCNRLQPTSEPQTHVWLSAAAAVVQDLTAAENARAQQREQADSGTVRISSVRLERSDGILGVGHTHSKGHTFNQVCSNAVAEGLQGCRFVSACWPIWATANASAALAGAC